ncbi:MAG: acyl-CoA thioesterase [Phycisphaerales bacterium]
MIGVPEMRPVEIAAAFAPADLDIPHPSPFVAEVIAGDGDLSQSVPHVNNVVYLSWVDRAAELHADALGFTRERMSAEGRIWFVASHSIDYLAEVFADERILAYTWIAEHRRVRTRRDTLLVRASDAAPVCRASSHWVMVDLETRRPVRQVTELIAAFEPLVVDASR